VLLPLLPVTLHVWLNEIHNAGPNKITSLHNLFFTLKREVLPLVNIKACFLLSYTYFGKQNTENFYIGWQKCGTVYRACISYRDCGPLVLHLVLPTCFSCCDHTTCFPQVLRLLEHNPAQDNGEHAVIRALRTEGSCCMDHIR
jgi:hypothetical protein